RSRGVPCPRLGVGMKVRVRMATPSSGHGTCDRFRQFVTRFGMSKPMLQRLHSFTVALAIVVSCTLLNRVSATSPTDIRPTRVIHCESVDDHRATVVTGVAMTRDAKVVAAATDDHRVLMWNAITGELNGHMDSHEDWVHSVVLSPDGAMLA